MFLERFFYNHAALGRHLCALEETALYAEENNKIYMYLAISGYCVITMHTMELCTPKNSAEGLILYE